MINTGKLIILLNLIFLLFFPKGGIKLSGIPITWGYIIFFMSSLFLILKYKIFNVKISKKKGFVILSMLSFQVYILISLYFNGNSNLGMTVSLIVSLILIPWLSIVYVGKYIDEHMDIYYLFKIVKIGLIFISIYGIFLFFYRIFTGKWIEVPFLTINFGDLGRLDEKFITRGGIYKLISTYNNGNIYGISVSILLPLYEFIEKSKIKKLIVKVSMVLTLSRTVWISLIVYELLIRPLINGIVLKKIIMQVIFVILIVFSLYKIAGTITSNPIGFLFDKNLGGRVGALDILHNFELVSTKPVSGIFEIVYLGVLNAFGLIGLLLFLFMMLSPIISSICVRNVYKKSLLYGLILYLIISLSDGAILLIPVMMFYWFIASLLISKKTISPVFPRDIRYFKSV